MTYIVLARKWRPMQFEDVVGQEHVSRTLMNALEQNRLGHAFIFSGPRGVGKTTTARLLAKAVNCENQPAINPCNQCQTCTSVTGGNNLDVIEIDGASNRGIDEIRNLRENIRFAPAVAKYKIYIIDEVHMLSKDAFNALLKTLEEPPSHAIFIFATTEIHRVPLTILSRCQRYDFKRIPTATITGQLEEIAGQEKINIDKESLLLIARKADGSMRDATSILDQITSFAKEKLTVEAVRESLGIISEELYFEFTDLMQTKNDGQVIFYAQKIMQLGHDLMNFIQGLEEHFRNLLVTKATGGTNLLETSDYYKSLYEKNSAQFSGKDLLHYVDILAQNEQLLKFSENPQLMLELLLLKLTHKPLSVELDELLKLLKNMPDNPGSGGTPASSPTPPPSSPSPATSGPGNTPSTKPPVTSSSPPARPAQGSPPSAFSEETPPKNHFTGLQSLKLPGAEPEPSQAAETVVETAPAESETALNISLDQISGSWSEIVAAVKKEKIALASFLQDGVPYQLAGNTWQVAFDPKTGFHMDHVQKNAKIIEAALKNKLQNTIKIQCLKLDFEDKGIQKQVQSPEEIFESMKDKEPVLKKIIDLFDCENLEE